MLFIVAVSWPDLSTGTRPGTTSKPPGLKLLLLKMILVLGLVVLVMLRLEQIMVLHSLAILKVEREAMTKSCGSLEKTIR